MKENMHICVFKYTEYHVWVDKAYRASMTRLNHISSVLFWEIFSAIVFARWPRTILSHTEQGRGLRCKVWEVGKGFNNFPPRKKGPGILYLATLVWNAKIMKSVARPTTHQRAPGYASMNCNNNGKCCKAHFTPKSRWKLTTTFAFPSKSIFTLRSVPPFMSQLDPPRLCLVWYGCRKWIRI